MQPSEAARDRPRVRVILADDHPLMLDALRQRIEQDDGLEVVATATDGEELVDRYRVLKPDVALVDVSMPKLDGIAATRRILDADPSARVVVLSADTGVAAVQAAIEAGAVGYLVKTIEGAALADAVHQAAAGETVLDATSSSAVVTRLRSRRYERRGLPLSDREVEVLALVSEGLRNAQVAERLFISLETVKTHMERIFEKFGVHDRVSAVRRGIEEGAIPALHSHASPPS